MDNDEHSLETRRLIYTLVHYGARVAKLSRKQENKLREWVLAYATDELGLSTSPMKIQDLRKYIDAWEHRDLSPENHKHYYVQKNTSGKSLWDFF